MSGDKIDRSGLPVRPEYLDITITAVFPDGSRAQYRYPQISMIEPPPPGVVGGAGATFATEWDGRPGDNELWTHQTDVVLPTWQSIIIKGKPLPDEDGYYAYLHTLDPEERATDEDPL